jgi:hypothetical protein
MSNTIQIMLGSSFFVGVGTLLLQSVLPAPPAIVVHALRYEEGVVHQSRTVTAKDQVVLLDWAAAVIDARTLSPVYGCEGVGTYGYPTGFGNYQMPLAQWVGSPACDPGPGEYFLRAVWTDGDRQVVATSPSFVVPDTRNDEEQASQLQRG